jgi:hypothetical protein
VLEPVGTFMMTILVVGVLVLVASLVLVAEARRPGVTSGKMTWVRWGRGVRGLAIFGLAVTIYIFIDGALDGRPVIGAVMALLFGTLAIPLFALGFFWGVGYGENGLHCISPWRKTRQVPWSDVLGVSFSVLMRQWVISTKSQGVIRVNELAGGSSGLIAAMTARGVTVEARPQIPA